MGAAAAAGAAESRATWPLQARTFFNGMPPLFQLLISVFG